MNGYLVSVSKELRLLTIHAHPDDESSKGAGTVALYADSGVGTTLVCCTGGEEGDILNPAMDRPEVRSNIASVRKDELAKAAKIIGTFQIDENSFPFTAIAFGSCLLYTSPSPRDLSTSRMPSSA